jgi:hypothetical protein
MALGIMAGTCEITCEMEGMETGIFIVTNKSPMRTALALAEAMFSSHLATSHWASSLKVPPPLNIVVGD